MRAPFPNPPSEVDASLPAVIAGRYRVERSLGKGGAAQLLRVVDLVCGETRALKLLHRNAHEKLRELFELEYQTLASIAHPRTVSVYEFGSEASCTFYTMELLEGEDLNGSAPVSWRQACEYLRDACFALGLLHARQLIHRDVSPRNLWRCRDGRVKLIDFGALAPFGANTHIIGTPPFVPPEALAGSPLDQRADLYALGAVAYYLLTGRHAYPARALNELPEQWAEPLPAPSRRVAQLARPELDAIPPELDALVLALLSTNEFARPDHAAEVIDRIDALRGDARPDESEGAEVRLNNVAFVARVPERRRLKRLFTLAAHGRGQACVIESAPGGGRTRGLKELGLAARVAHATVLHANAVDDGALYGTANVLALALLDALPERARAAAAPHAGLLAHVSPRLRHRLVATPAPLSEVPGELRVQVQEALRAWFMALAVEQPLVVLVDGLERVDDGSAAFLLALSLGCRSARILLACALVRERTREYGLVLRALIKASHRLVLGRLNEPELRELLRSVFGPAEHLARLSVRLFRATHGNPGHALELCRQLVQRGALTFDGGAWSLPRELDMQALPATREQALLARLGRVQGPARELARTLSIQAGPITPAMCRELAGVGGRDLLPCLGLLLAHEVLVPVGPNLAFANPLFRSTCASELSPDQRARARRRLGEHLLSAPDAGPFERAQGGVHLVAAGDPRGAAIVAHECVKLVVSEGDKLGPAAPAIEEALTLFRAQGYSSYAQAPLMAALVLGGYDGDRRYIAEFGEPAIRLLEEMVGLNLARKLSRYLGGASGLLAALAWSAIRLQVRRDRACLPKFSDVIQLLFASVIVVSGADILCFDPEAATRHAAVLRPFAALGPSNIGSFMNDFCDALVQTSRDRAGSTYESWKRLLARLEPANAFRAVPRSMIQRLRGGALFALATMEAYVDDDRALRTADNLAENGLLFDRMCADQARTLYYGFHGQLAQYEHYCERAEQHAIQRGTTWQIENWSAGPASVMSVCLHDAMSMKSASEQIRRLSKQIPSLQLHARFAHGTYLLLRGKHDQAVPWLEDCLQQAPGSRNGWGRAHGVLARAYNMQADYASARDACQRVLDHYSAADFAFPVMNLIVHTEFAIALAGLGRNDDAQSQLARLHELHAANGNPLTLAMLHEAGVKIALIASDLPAAREAFAHLEDAYSPIRSPSAAQYCQRLSAHIEQRTLGSLFALGSVDAGLTGSLMPDNSELARSIELELAAPDIGLEERAQLALQLLAGQVHANDGALYFVQDDASLRLAAALTGGRPSAGVEIWLRSTLARELADDETQLTSEDGLAHAASDVMREGELSHRLLFLRSRDGGGHGVIGLVLFSRASDAPLTCASTLADAVARQLHKALANEEPDLDTVAVAVR